MSDKLFYQVALTLLPGIGPVTAKKLISYCGGVEAIFHTPARQLRKIPSIGTRLAQVVHDRNSLLRAERELEFIKKQHIRPLFFLDPDFPTRLNRYEDCPIMLYFRGNTDLNPRRSIGFIGTRQPTARGLAQCADLVTGIRACQPLIVSGLAFGIDVQAHRAALQNKLDTVAVLGHGLDRIYPFQHRKVAQEMLEQGGLLTEFPSDTQPDRENFPKRNRIVAALCDVIVVVESAARGGSLITAELANQYHKDVYAIPGRPGDERSAGCNYLIKSHRAGLIESADDLLYALGWEPAAGESVGLQSSLFPELSPLEQRTVDQIRQAESPSFDQLADRLELAPGELSSLLLEMELKGIVKSVPGNRFVLL